MCIRDSSRAAEIVRQHHWLDRMPSKADETLVVYLADKMIQGDKEVSIDERFEKSLAKCAGNSEALKWHNKKSVSYTHLDVYKRQVSVFKEHTAGYRQNFFF